MIERPAARYRVSLGNNLCDRVLGGTEDTLVRLPACQGGQEERSAGFHGRGTAQTKGLKRPPVRCGVPRSHDLCQRPLGGEKDPARRPATSDSGGGGNTPRPPNIFSGLSHSACSPTP